jgi:hypothetical protein
MTRTKKCHLLHFLAPAALALVPFAALLALRPAATAIAQQQPPVLHEFFTYTPGDVAGSPSDIPALPEPGREDPSEEADTSGLIVQTAYGPSFDDAFAPPWQDEPPQLPDRWNQPIGMDLNTTAPDLLQYLEAFTPSVAPFKRLGARNRVIGTAEWGEFQLAVPENGAAPVPISSRMPEGYDLFTGTVALETDGLQLIPVPSVAPDELVLQARTVPDAEVQWLRDEAGNAFVAIDTPGQFKLHWLVAVHPDYFAAPLLPATLPRQAPAQAPGLRQAATEILTAAGSTAAAPDHEIVQQLTRWLQAFQATETPMGPQPEQSDFLAVALAQRGVCRHRALIFVVVLQAIGIRAQYVYNEAHAFVEVNLSGRWRRIDLGGAADDVQLVGNPDTPLYEAPVDALAPNQPPVQNTAFGPPRNAQTQTQAQTNANTAPTDHDNGGQNPSNGDITRTGAGPDDALQGGSNAPPLPSAPNAAHAEHAGPGSTTAAQTTPTAEVSPEGSPENSPVSPDGRLWPTLRLIDVPISVYRGDTFAVSASLTTPQGEPIHDRTLSFVLSADRTGAGQAPLRLGTCTTSDQGICTIALQIPSQVRAGNAALGVEFGGDDQWAGTSTLAQP